jgi:cell shape-determining protein MreD
MVTSAPLGFHAFQFALAGYLFGLGSGNVYFDPLVMPALMGFLATVFTVLTSFLLNAVFQLGSPISAFLNIGLLFQLLLNVLLAPLIFWLYGWAREKFQDPRRGFGG